MPHVNIWIRQDDYEKWKAIGDKPSFIHDAIQVQNSIKVGTMYPKVIKTKKDAEKAIEPIVYKKTNNWGA